MIIRPGQRFYQPFHTVLFLVPLDPSRPATRGVPQIFAGNRDERAVASTTYGDVIVLEQVGQSLHCIAIAKRRKKRDRLQTSLGVFASNACSPANRHELRFELGERRELRKDLNGQRANAEVGIKGQMRNRLDENTAWYLARDKQRVEAPVRHGRAQQRAHIGSSAIAKCHDSTGNS